MNWIGAAVYEARLSTALWASVSDRRLNPSIRISRATERTLEGDYGVLVDALGSTSDQLLAGWWTSWAKEVRGLFATSGERVTLWEESDLDWFVWETDWARVSEVMRESGLEPGLLATRLPGWVLLSPPSGADMFLYPELSASDA